jgi:hypothetical protein
MAGGYGCRMQLVVRLYDLRDQPDQTAAMSADEPR